MTRAAQRDVYTVARVNREARRLLEGGLPMLWVAGEISNLAMPASGHWYFTLKDADAQIRCAMFRGRNRGVRVRPQNGQQVIVRGRVSLYEPRGDYQLIAEHMTDSGEGALQRAYEELKAKLDKQGLFDTDIKSPLPTLPRRIGVITSPSGAVIRDIAHVLARRFPAVPVVIYPVPVQGDAAAPAIVQAIRTAEARAECDVLIIARGGGSLEDLWPFNEEAVAWSVFECPIPTVSAVGHETDVTICDFVADVRAPTPSAAAELVVPDRATLMAALRATDQRGRRALHRHLEQATQSLRHLTLRHRARHPGTIVQRMAQRVDDAERRLGQALTRTLTAKRHRLQRLGDQLLRQSPDRRLAALSARLASAGRALDQSMTTRVRRERARLDLASRALDTMGPQATLERGYAIVTKANDGRIANDAAQLSVGDQLDIRLARGTAGATVDATIKKSES
ncbi:MAG: exodeoxyribonuclease VII large subunit [Gammaproteobacteria bacterium]